MTEAVNPNQENLVVDIASTMMHSLNETQQ
jgi:chemotaxis protein CheZ